MKAKFFLAIALIFGIAINSASAQSYGKDRRDRNRVENGRRGDFRNDDGYRSHQSPKHFRKNYRSKQFYGHARPGSRHYFRYKKAPKFYSYHHRQHRRFN